MTKLICCDLHLKQHETFVDIRHESWIWPSKMAELLGSVQIEARLGTHVRSCKRNPLALIRHSRSEEQPMGAATIPYARLNQPKSWRSGTVYQTAPCWIPSSFPFRPLYQARLLAHVTVYCRNVLPLRCSDQSSSNPHRSLPNPTHS